jgi:CRP/FNR family transcriptional regulator
MERRGGALLENINGRERVWHLGRAPLLAGLEPEELEAVSRRARDRVYAEGRVIFSAGTAADELFILNRGTVRLSLTGDGDREKTLELLRGGDCFGLEAAREGRFHQIQASAHEECWVSVFSRDDFLAVSRHFPVVCDNLTRLLLDRLSVAHEQIAALCFMEIEQRLARTLLRLADRHGQRSHRLSGLVRLKIRLTHDALARLIGANRPYLSNILSHFRKNGLIRYQGTSLLLDVNALGQLDRGQQGPSVMAG